MGQRTARLDELLREEISAIVTREVSDPRVGFVTITDVEVGADLRHATVWVSVIGAAEERRASLKALGRAMPFVRGKLGRLRLKRIPELHVREDDSAERGTRLLHLIDRLETAGDADPDALDESLPSPSLREQGEAVLPVEPRRRRSRRRTSR